MKQHLLLLSGSLLLAAATTAQAQTPGVGIGTTAPDASAALDIISTTKGVLLPRVANAAALASPATGLLVFQTGAPAGFYYNAGTPAVPSWQQLATASGAAITADNGLTKTGQNIQLGGPLTGNTTVGLGNSHLTLSSTGGGVGIGTTGSGSFRLNVNGALRTTVANGQFTLYNNAPGAGTVLLGALEATGGIGPQLRFSGAGSGFMDIGQNSLGDFVVEGSDNARLTVLNGGRVGIGTSSPAAMLDVQGGADSNGGSDPVALAFSWRGNGYRHFVRSRHNAGVTGSGNNLDFYLNSSTTSAGSASPGTGNVQVMTMESNNGQARVGIGTIAPVGRLHIVNDDGGGGAADDYLIDEYGPGDQGIYLRHAGGTLAAPTDLSNGEHIGRLSFVPRFGSVLGYVGGSMVQSYYRGNGSNNLTDLQLYTSGTERLRISETGNVGIGTTTPGAKLEVNGDLRVPAANAYTYATPKAYSRHLGAADFMPQTSATTKLAGPYHTFYPGAANGVFEASVHLPQGAAIANLSVFLGDNISGNSINIKLQAVQQVTGNTSTLADYTSVDNFSTYQWVTVPATTTIDNNNFNYYLQVTMTSSSSTLSVGNVRVNYTVNQAE
ncbi:hypothetical protein GCM10023185_01420 [Hymenobacter saemangeumensis]|uniref:Uncharacterized protein n=1 Tax=Hymenobacter saemangeumensis TaxID=1084522 RepID=A0ABP8HXE6_9BACT